VNKNLILLSHGNFCVELKNSVEMIMGPQENIKSVPLLEEEGKEDYKKKLISIVDEEAIVLADLKGGTPANIASELLLEGNIFNLYTGMNMPMVIEYINSNMLDTDYNPLVSGKDNITHINESLDL